MVVNYIILFIFVNDFVIVIFTFYGKMKRVISFANKKKP